MGNCSSANICDSFIGSGENPLERIPSSIFIGTVILFFGFFIMISHILAILIKISFCELFKSWYLSFERRLLFSIHKMKICVSIRKLLFFSIEKFVNFCIFFIEIFGDYYFAFPQTWLAWF